MKIFKILHVCYYINEKFEKITPLTYNFQDFARSPLVANYQIWRHARKLTKYFSNFKGRKRKLRCAKKILK
jgi:hypothetical protein